MRKRWVEGISWSGGALSSFVVLEDGPLLENSIVTPPTLYLLELAKTGKSFNTSKAVADDLKSYFQTLKEYSVDWRFITDNEMSGYLQKILFVSRSLSSESIGRHTSSIKGMYAFAADHGLLEQEPALSFNYDGDRDDVRSTKKLGKPNFQLFRQYLNSTIFELVLAGIRACSPFKRERDELVLKFGFHCGLRTSEVTDSRNFDTSKIRTAIEEAESRGELSFCLDIFGKGKKIRQVDFNPIITRDIKSFLEGRRSKIIDGPLICRDNGQALSSSHATRVFKTARDASIVGIKKAINNKKNSTEEFTINLQSIKRLVFHSLRHTYATNLVRYCYKMKIDPWVYVRDQMGHERKETTEAYIVFEANIHGRDKIRKSFSLVDEGG